MGDAPLIVLKELAGNPPPQLNGIQAFFAPHAEALVSLWIALWIVTAMYMIVFVIREYQRRHR